MSKNVSVVNIKLSNTQKYKKFQLASLAGYKVQEIDSSGRCVIIGADNCIDNDFRNIDQVLMLISNELYSKGFCVAA